MTETAPRTWVYGLTADEWLHLASEGDKSEVQPCCGNMRETRRLLMGLTTVQDDNQSAAYIRWSYGSQLIEAVEAEGVNHNLANRDFFPLLHRVIDGLKAERAYWQAEEDRHIRERSRQA